LAGIGVIFNPLSGSHQRDPRTAQRLARTLGEHGVVREAGSIEDLYRVANEFRKLDIDVLAISGGDGTSGVAITGFLDVYAERALPKIALLRGGTMNTIANSVGVRRGRPDGLLAQLLSAYRARSTVPLPYVERHVLGIRTRDARPSISVHPSMPALTAKYGFLFGTGVVYGFLAEYYAAGGRPTVAAMTLLRAAGSTLVQGPMIRRMAEPFRGSVVLDDGTVWEERDYLSIAGGTVDGIGLSFKPFYRSSESPNKFHLLGIYTSPLRFLAQLDPIYRGRAMRPGHAHDALVERATVHSSRYPLKYMVDGDLYESNGPLEVSIGPVVRLVLVGGVSAPPTHA
jgi:diacylglycerol kinase family enzyme